MSEQDKIMREICIWPTKDYPARYDAELRGRVLVARDNLKASLMSFDATIRVAQHHVDSLMSRASQATQAYGEERNVVFG